MPIPFDPTVGSKIVQTAPAVLVMGLLCRLGRKLTLRIRITTGQIPRV